MNETGDLGEAKSDFAEPSFPELGRNSIFIEVMLIVSSHYKSREDVKLMIVTL